MLPRLPGQLDPTFELQEMLMSPETSIEDVLKLPYITRVANMKLPRFQSFMIERSRDLLRLAFSPERSSESTGAFRVLASGDRTFLATVLADNSFCDWATELLSNPNPPQFLIGRLSALTLTAFICLPDAAVESCGYIYRLLPYCENPTVFNLFQTLTSSDENVGPAQTWLKNMGFAEYIEREASAIDHAHRPEKGNAFKDPVFNRACYMYILIASSCESPTLAPEFQKKSIVACLKECFENQPDFVTTAQWRAIVAITCEATAYEMLHFVPIAVDMLAEQFSKLLEYRVLALQFLTKMVQLAPLAFDLLMEKQMPQMLIYLVLRFPNSTILHNAFVRFVEVGVEQGKFTAEIVNIYVPVLVDASVEYRVLKPCFIRVMEIFVEQAKQNPEMAALLEEHQEAVEFVEGPMKDYQALSNTPYGGDLPLSLNFFKGFFS